MPEAERVGGSMTGAVLAKGIVDMTFGGAFLWYAVKYIICGVAAAGAVLLGIKLRKRKDAKAAELSKEEV